MRLLRLSTLASAAAFLFASGNVQGQEYYQASGQTYGPYTQLFSAEELDNLVAPIALYPDPILAQVFVAATFADQIDVASRHVRLFGTDAVDIQPWDVSVKAVAHYPPLLNMLAERTDWTAAVGQAYAVQSNDVMDAVQRLRHMAQYQGNLVSTPQQTVIIEREVIRIVPAQPRVIYVPVYDPAVIYYRRAVFQASIHTPFWSFGIAFPIGSWLNYDCDWYGRRVYYDGWRGHGWRTASRPFIQIVNVYVNPRYEVVNINHTIVHRTVNYVNLNKNNSVHGNVKFDGYERNIQRIASNDNGSLRGGGAGQQRGGGAGPQRGGGAGPQRGGSSVQGNSGQVYGRGANAVPSTQARPQQQQQQSTSASSQRLPQQSAPASSQRLPQQNAPASSQRLPSPSGRAQPVERPEQAPVMQRQGSVSHSQAPVQRSAPSSYPAPATRQPQVIQRPQQQPQQSQQSQSQPVVKSKPAPNAHGGGQQSAPGQAKSKSRGGR